MNVSLRISRFNFNNSIPSNCCNIIYSYIPGHSLGCHSTWQQWLQTEDISPVAHISPENTPSEPNRVDSPETILDKLIWKEKEI